LFNASIFDDTDDNYFNGMFRNSRHILHPFIKDRTKPIYDLKQRTHQKELISKFVNMSDQYNFFECYIKICTDT